MFKEQTQGEVEEAIDGERAYQQIRWGTDHESHEVGAYILYTQDYLEEAVHQAKVGMILESLHSLRKVVALAVVCLERWKYPAARPLVYQAMAEQEMIVGPPMALGITARYQLGLDVLASILRQASNRQARDNGDDTSLHMLHIFGGTGMYLMRSFGAPQRKVPSTKLA